MGDFWRRFAAAHSHPVVPVSDDNKTTRVFLNTRMPKAQNWQSVLKSSLTPVWERKTRDTKLCEKRRDKFVTEKYKFLQKKV